MLRLLGLGIVLIVVGATPAWAVVIDFNAPAYTDAPLPGQTDPAYGLWTSTTDVGFINVENSATNGRLIIQPNPSAPFHNALLNLSAPVLPDANNKIIARFDFIESTEGVDGGNIWKMMFRDAAGNDLSRVQGQKDRVVGRLPQAGGMITPPMIVGGGNPTTRTMFIEIDSTGDGGMTSYYQDSIGPANLLGAFPYTTLDDQVSQILIETFNRTDIADNRARIDNINIVGAPERPRWNIDDNGNWSTAANWTVGVPNAAGAQALFGSVITAPHTVTADVPITVGGIEFDNANAYTIAGSNSNTITLDATSGDARINVTSGSHTISAPVLLADNTVITVSPADSNLLITGAFSASGITLTKDGAGTLQVNNLRAAALSVTNGTVAVQPSVGTSVIGALSIAGDAIPSAKLDLTNSAAIVDYPAAGPNPETTIRDQIISGRGGIGLGKIWDGFGITSSHAAADPVNSGSVGYANNATMPLGSLATFRGQAVDASTVIMRYTRTADANLDGVVNNDDVTIVGANYAPGFAKPFWALGDFDYSGFVDDDDVTLLGVYYNPSATPIPTPSANSSTSTVAVPEPASVILFALGCIAILIVLGRNVGEGHNYGLIALTKSTVSQPIREKETHSNGAVVWGIRNIGSAA